MHTRLIVKAHTALMLATFSAATLAAPDLRTVAERSGFVQTGRYDEVIALCHDYAKTWPRSVRCVEFGRTPENRPMLALVANLDGVLTANAARKARLPVLLVQGGIHAGEIDGKDAGFLALREMLQEPGPKAALRRQVLVFVPVFNVDGHERFGRWNRPNQRGPEQMGWRTTAQNINLNRDYVKADAPEMQAMLGLVNQWDPLLYVDMHVTDGAKFEHDISIQIEPTRSGDATMNQAGKLLQGEVLAALEKTGSLPRSFYYAFNIDDEPLSGFTDGVPTPRFSHGYFQLRNRFGMLVETHSWKDYPTRVRISKNTILASAAGIAQYGQSWLQSAHQADSASAQLAGQAVTMSWKPTDQTKPVAFHGYAWQHEMSAISGTKVIRYDESKPQIWQVLLKDQVEPDLRVTAPKAGYFVPAAHAGMMAQKLALHGITFTRLDKALAPQPMEAFRASGIEWASQSYEGHQRLSQQGQWQVETRSLPSGSLFVPIAQPKARLVMTLLEPQNPDSLVAWGLFNNAYEQKEYMEAYVVEDVAKADMAAHPELAAQFRKKLEQEPQFAASPRERMEFFAKRHPSWDEQYRLYPVLRAITAP